MAALRPPLGTPIAHYVFKCIAIISTNSANRYGASPLQWDVKHMRHVLIDIDVEGNYACRVEGPMDLDGFNLDDLSLEA